MQTLLDSLSSVNPDTAHFIDAHNFNLIARFDCVDLDSTDK